MYKTQFVYLLLILFWSGCAHDKIRVTSPDKNITFNFRLSDNSPLYSLRYKGKKILGDSRLGLTFEKTGSLDSNLEVLKPVYSQGTDDYSLVVGKTSHVHDQYNEEIIPLRETIPPFRRVNIIVRVFNDGLAFRYQIPEQENWKSFSIKEENTAFNINGDPMVHTLFLPDFTTSHEGEFSSFRLHAVKEDTLMDIPTLFEFPDHIYMAITEAELRDYSGMYLIKRNGIVKCQLTPYPGKPGIKVVGDIPHDSPWRVLLISDRVGALIESNIITSLNEPCKIKDVSWIKPGKITWPWWNGDIVPDTVSFKPGNNFATNKYYIDFCARYGIEYHSIVEWGGHEWYRNDGQGFQPGEHVDVTQPVPGLDIRKIVDYARTKGVGIRFWVHFRALYPQLDTAFAVYEKWGIKGLMVDFMDRSDQPMVNMQEEILKKAAEHKLHIQFHGAYKPTGLWRTYPNELTREGVMNYEYDKWDKVTPDHDIMTVFTRMLAGPADYHMGGFRAVPDSLFKPREVRPNVLGTRCHMLAMYVVLENYLNMVADYPEAYEGQPGFDFVTQVPTVWDETKVLNADVGKYITIARRKGKVWYLGSITNHDSRTMVISFSFLGDGNYEAVIYSDSKDDVINPNLLDKQTMNISNQDSLSVNLASGGGVAMRIIKK